MTEQSLAYTMRMEIERLTAENERLRAETQWQPIETAPDDTVLFLGWWLTWPNAQWECVADLACSTKGGWKHGQATHWMPIPPPPAQEDTP